MEIPVSAQALTFAQGALLGLGLCLAYDLLRALRQLCPRMGLAADALFGLLLTASFCPSRSRRDRGSSGCMCSSPYF